jgi:hypothetical protein
VVGGGTVTDIQTDCSQELDRDLLGKTTDTELLRSSTTWYMWSMGFRNPCERSMTLVCRTLSAALPAWSTSGSDLVWPTWSKVKMVSTEERAFRRPYRDHHERLPNIGVTTSNL